VPACAKRSAREAGDSEALTHLKGTIDLAPRFPDRLVGSVCLHPTGARNCFSGYLRPAILLAT
jgi:hypothetical protein